jgi:membrane fusion protein (multidrug efflux system)
MCSLRRSQPVRLSVDAWPDRTFEGRLGYIAPAVDDATRQLPVVAVVEDPAGRLKPGAFASAEVTVEVRQGAPGVPEESLVATRDGYVVFIVEDGVARRRPVTVGLRKPGRAEVREGVEIDETIVRGGHMGLTDGQAVRVTTPATATTTAPNPRSPAGP